MVLRPSHYLIIVFLLTALIFSIEFVLATAHTQSLTITDIKVSEDSTFYKIKIFFKHDYYTVSPYNDDDWDIMIAWAWGATAQDNNLIGFESASAYITESCSRRYLGTIDEANSYCSLTEFENSFFATLQAIKAPNCPPGIPECCFKDYGSLSPVENSAGGYILLDDIKKEKFDGPDSGSILIEMRFNKQYTNWDEFRDKVLDGIYIVMAYDPHPLADDVIFFVWKSDDTHVDHDWYFKEVLRGLLGTFYYCTPSDITINDGDDNPDNDGDGSSLMRLVDSMDEGGPGVCDDWTAMGPDHKTFYDGATGAWVLKLSQNLKCDSHIIKPIPAGGGRSTCTDHYWVGDYECIDQGYPGTNWASHEKKLGRDVGMQCDKDDDYYQCYDYDCDITDNTCIKCNGKIQSAGKTGVNKCEENCGADSKCDEIDPLTLGCFSNCCFGDLNEDGKRNIIDLSIMAKTFGLIPKDLNYNPKADIDNNGRVDILDVANVAKTFGTTC